MTAPGTEIELPEAGEPAVIGPSHGNNYSYYICNSLALKRLLEKIPANTYKGQEREVLTPAVRAMLVARRDLSDDIVYKFTKAIFDNLGQFHSAHAAAKGLTLQTALNGMPVPLHPGAEKFYREKGIAR